MINGRNNFRTSHTIHGHNVRFGIRVFHEERDAVSASESPSRICLRSNGGSFGMVTSDSKHGYVQSHGQMVCYACCRRIYCRSMFLLAIDYITPHLHLGKSKPEGPRSHLSRTAMLSLAVTIHNLPEGMAVGVVLAGAMQSGAGITAAAALAMSLGIAIQNIPEGAIISMPMRAEGNSRIKSFILGSLSGIVEPIGGIIVILLASMMTPVLPYLLAFAAGAMLYVVVEELIPEASEGEHSNIGVIGFSAGFVLMMILDAVLG